jgi:hypothetical protein
MDMLSRFFKNNQNNTVKSSQVANANAGVKWYIKPHAEDDFWNWVGTWAIPIRKPSDLGFFDERYKLPELIENQTEVYNKNTLIIDNQYELINKPALSFKEIKAEVRATINERCEKAVELANNHDTSVYWVNLNDEASIIKKLDNTAVEIKGTMNVDKKEDYLLAFSKGEIKKLITKTSITAFGLNWQHCNHTVYFPTYSYEQYYQAIRRFWRFGQERPVTVDLVLSDGQAKIMEALQAKKNKADDMFARLTKSINSKFELSTREFNQDIKKPTFI